MRVWRKCLKFISWICPFIFPETSGSVVFIKFNTAQKKHTDKTVTQKIHSTTQAKFEKLTTVPWKLYIGLKLQE